MIPRTIHQVWIGPDTPPFDMMMSWQSAHPEWDYRLWREDDIPDMGLSEQAQKLVDAYVADGRYCGAVNVMRAFILYNHGGVYIDADMECGHKLDDAWFIRDHSCFISQSPHEPTRSQNAAMGCIKYSAIMGIYCQKLNEVSIKDIHPSWQKTGAVLFDEVRVQLPKQIGFVPSPAFHPYNKFGSLNPMIRNYVGHIYAKHHFYSTNHRRMV